MGTSPDCAVLGCGTGASGDGGRRQRDGSIFSRSDENVFSHRARDARWREKPRRFWCGFERVLARRVAVGGNGGSAHQRARCDRRCRACDAGGRTGWRTSRAAVARLARVSAVFARALTVERHSVSTGVAGGIFTSRLVRHVAPVFALTVPLHSVSTGFFRPRAVVLTVRMHRVWSRRWRHISTSRSLDSSGCVRCSPFGFTDIRVSWRAGCPHPVCIVKRAANAPATGWCVLRRAWQRCFAEAADGAHR
ncbi:hypothetical protein C6Q35_04125 [Burkholderia multivorans]|nr:hypothetical protein C6Q35_04125 [Burkholderia multivorans]